MRWEAGKGKVDRERADISIRMTADEFRVCGIGQWPDLSAFQKPHLKLHTNTPAP